MSDFTLRVEFAGYTLAGNLRQSPCPFEGGWLPSNGQRVQQRGTVTHNGPSPCYLLWDSQLHSRGGPGLGAGAGQGSLGQERRIRGADGRLGLGEILMAELSFRVPAFICPTCNIYSTQSWAHALEKRPGSPAPMPYTICTGRSASGAITARSGSKSSW